MSNPVRSFTIVKKTRAKTTNSILSPNAGCCVGRMKLKCNSCIEAMDTSPIAKKPKSAVPSRLSNGTNHSSRGGSPLARTSVNAKERDKLTASIRSSNSQRVPIDLETVDRRVSNGHGYHPANDASNELSVNSTELDISPRDPRDEPPEPTPSAAASRPASPYTLNPPIDFDGLSWPSEFSDKY